MTTRSHSNTALIALAQACLLGAAAVSVTPLPAMAQDTAPLVVNLSGDSPERTPGARPDPKSVEGGIWADADKAEHAANSSGERDPDPALRAYVSSVEAKVAGPFAGDIRLSVMDRPFFNAEVNPNGYAEVWSGLLLRAQTEDQLAFVLGHETAHFRHSHGMKRYKELKDNAHTMVAVTAVIAVVAVGAAANSSGYASNGTYYSGYDTYGDLGGTLIDVSYLASVAALMSYSRETEAEADAYGLSYASQAGYFSGGGAQLWQDLLDETAASDSTKVRRSVTRNNFFGSHPLETDRVDALNAQDRKMHGGAPSTRSDADEKAARLAYREHIRPFLGSWLKDDLRRKDYGQTIFLINRMAIDGQDMGVLNFYKGEAYRLRGKPEDQNAALDCYQTALKNSDAPPETQRQLGDVYRHMGNSAEALNAFKAYLALAPQANDAWIVQDEVDTLSKSLSAAAPVSTPTAAPVAAISSSTAADAATTSPAAAVPAVAGKSQGE